ncbi:helix-turn-helix domain-containing protein [Streptomyces tendae]
MSLATVDIASLADAGEPAPVLLTVEEAARCLRVGRTTCYALIRAGELESLTIGGLRRVPADAPAAYLARRRAEQRAA